MPDFLDLGTAFSTLVIVLFVAYCLTCPLEWDPQHPAIDDLDLRKEKP